MSAPSAPQQQPGPSADPTVADLVPIVRAFAWRFCRASNGRLSLDDLTQAGLLAAHASLLAGAAYPPESRRSHAIARSQWAMLDHMRVEVRHNQRLHPDPIEQLAEPAAGPAGTARTPAALVEPDTPEAIATRRQVARVTAQAIATLSPRQREALAAAYSDDPHASSTASLAAQWQVDASRVRQVRAQALQALRCLLGVDRAVPASVQAEAARAIHAAAHGQPGSVHTSP